MNPIRNFAVDGSFKASSFTQLQITAVSMNLIGLGRFEDQSFVFRCHEISAKIFNRIGMRLSGIAGEPTSTLVSCI